MLGVFYQNLKNDMAALCTQNMTGRKYGKKLSITLNSSAYATFADVLIVKKTNKLGVIKYHENPCSLLCIDEHYHLVMENPADELGKNNALH